MLKGQLAADTGELIFSVYILQIQSQEQHKEEK